MTVILKPKDSKKVVPKKPKPTQPAKKAAKKSPAKAAAKKTPAKKTPAKKAENKETALAIVDKGQIEKFGQEEPIESGFSESFLNQARKLDKRIRERLDRIDRDLVEVGEMGLEMKDKAYYKALGYSTNADYFNAIMPAGMKKTQVFQAMKIVRELTSGESPAVSKEDVRSMTKENAEGLAQMKSRGVEITPERIDQAKTMRAEDFRREVVHPNAPDLQARHHAEQGVATPTNVSVMMTLKMELPSEVYADFKLTMEIARHLVGDDDRTVSLEEKAFAAILAEFRNTYEAEYLATKAALSAEASHTAEQADLNMASKGEAVEELELEDESQPEPLNIIPGPQYDFDDNGQPLDAEEELQNEEHEILVERTIEREDEIQEVEE